MGSQFSRGQAFEPCRLASAALSGMVGRAMATSSSDDDDKDKANDGEEPSAEESEAGDAAAEGSSDASAGDNAPDDESAEEDTAPAKRSAKLAKEKTSSAAPASPAAKKPAVGPSKQEPLKPPPSAGLGKSVMLFAIVVGSITLLMLLLGSERGISGPAAPTWKEGDTVDVDITLVSTDKQDLACASGGDVKGFHCGFESQGKRWTKSDPADEKKTLRPYSTTTGINFLAAGVWSDPALSGELPKTRFAVTCKLNVAGKMPRADVRWHEGEGWNSVNEWFTGDVSNCKLSSIQK